MKRVSILILVITALIAGCAEHINQTEDSKAIIKVLMRQQAAWNNADLDGYLSGYWDNSNLRFVTKRKIEYGLDDVRVMYANGYKTKEDFGTLSFDLQEVDVLSDNLATVVGTYLLEYDDRKNRNGRFTLILRKINGEWKVIQDHTS